MSGSVQYHQKCVCGAEIKVTGNFSFIATGETRKSFEAWQYEHRTCLMLFREIQSVRLRRLTGIAARASILD